MSAVAFGWRWGHKVEEARKKGDDLTTRTDQAETVFATRVARLNAASDRAERAAVAFLREHENVMVVAAKARQKRT